MTSKDCWDYIKKRYKNTGVTFNVSQESLLGIFRFEFIYNNGQHCAVDLARLSNEYGVCELHFLMDTIIKIHSLHETFTNESSTVCRANIKTGCDIKQF